MAIEGNSKEASLTLWGSDITSRGVVIGGQKVGRLSNDSEMLYFHCYSNEKNVTLKRLTSGLLTT